MDVVGPYCRLGEVHLIDCGAVMLHAPTPKPELRQFQLAQVEKIWSTSCPVTAARAALVIEESWGYVAGPYCVVGAAKPVRAVTARRARAVDPSLPTANDLKQLAKAERALAVAVSLPRSKPDRLNHIHAAADRRREIESNLRRRAAWSANAEAAKEADRLEAMRGGKIVEERIEAGVNPRRRITVDGLSFVLECGKVSLVPAVRKQMRRCWVAGMLYRTEYGRRHDGDLGSQMDVGDGGGVTAAQGSAELAMLYGALSHDKLDVIEAAVSCGRSGPRQLQMLQQVAGCGRSVRSQAGGGKNVYLAELALFRALELAAIAMLLP